MSDEERDIQILKIVLGGWLGLTTILFLWRIAHLLGVLVKLVNK